MSDLFQGVEQRRKSADVHVKCAFLEIHNEEVKDLLHPETPSKSISIRERGDGAFRATLSSVVFLSCCGD